MAFSKAQVQPPARAAEMLIGPPEEKSAPYNQTAPGLYPDQVAIDLGDGTTVAVSVVPEWLENGEGVLFTAWARWIDPDGSTRLSAHGRHMETAFTFSADAMRVERVGVEALSKEMLLAVLGEPPTMMIVDGAEIPLVAWAEDVRMSASIRHAIKSAANTGPEAIDPAKTLGLLRP